MGSGEMGRGEMAEMEMAEISVFQSCEEIPDVDFRFVEECAAKKEEKEEVTDILLERLVMKAWKVYQVGDLLNYSNLFILSNL